jgi:hypothetical protein
MSNAISSLDGFPAGRRLGRKGKHYRLDEVQRWAKGKDVAGLVRAANARRVAEQNVGPLAAKPISPFNDLCLRFAAGEFLPAQQKQQIDFKRLVARTARPKTQSVHLVHDWMLEDGPRAQHRRTACQK